jgi:hypothetical protein
LFPGVILFAGQIGCCTFGPEIYPCYQYAVFLPVCFPLLFLH